MIEESRLNNLIQGMEEIKSILTEKKDDDVSAMYVQAEKARLILGVSRKTWQEYRNKRDIPFIQFGRKIYVKKADLEDFMNKHYIK